MDRERAARHFRKSQRHLEAIRMGKALERKALQLLERGWDDAFAAEQAERERKRGLSQVKPGAGHPVLPAAGQARAGGLAFGGGGDSAWAR